MKGADLLQAILSVFGSALCKICFPATVSLFHYFLTLKIRVMELFQWIGHGDVY